MTDESYLYHIRRSCDSGELSKGYIGISNNPTKRYQAHQRGGHNVHLDNALTKYADVDMVVLTKGSRREMLDMEEYLRPTKHIGWNVAAGGCMPPTWDEIKDPVAKKKAISEKLTGKIVSASTRLKLSIASTGKVHSDETKKKLSDIGKTKTGSANNNFKGWWEVSGTRYESLTLASVAIGVKWPTIRQRALSSNFEEYKFIPKESVDGR